MISAPSVFRPWLYALALALALVAAPATAQAPPPAPPAAEQQAAEQQAAEQQAAEQQAAEQTPAEPAPEPEKTVSFSRDAGPHDQTASIEWWYFNAFLKSKGQNRYAVVGSFFRVGLPGTKKGHYLIYSLADLKSNRRVAHSVMDQQCFRLLRSMAGIQMTLRPEDPAPRRLLALLQKGELPRPHQVLSENAKLQTDPLFAISMSNNSLTQEDDQGRSWRAVLNGSRWTLALTLKQPERPEMLVGGKGMTGVKRPDEMYYVSLTRMEVAATLSEDGVETDLNGVGWLDRQWGSPEFLQNYGWDWLGIQLEDGSDLILFRLRNLANNGIVKIEGTVLTADGQTIVEQPTAFRRTSVWTDPASRITFPATFDISLPTSGYNLQVAPVFPEQTIPVLGIGEAIWEGVVSVAGTNKAGEPVLGNGYLELVGYRSSGSGSGASKKAGGTPRNVKKAPGKPR